MYLETMKSRSGLGVRLNVMFDRVPLSEAHRGSQSDFYSMRVVLSKSDLNAVQAVYEALEQSCELCGASGCRYVTDGDDTPREDYWDCILIDCFSSNTPLILGLQDEIADGSISNKFYSRCFGTVALSFRPTSSGVIPQFLFAIKSAEGIPTIDEESPL